MRRTLAAAFAPLLALACAPVPKGAEDAEPNELPRGFLRDDIAKAAPPYGGEATTHVLAWIVRQDERPFRVESCLVLKVLKEDSDRGRYCLSHIYRHPSAAEPEWRLPPLWISPPDEVPIVTVEHFKRFHEKPTNKAVAGMLKDVQWSFEFPKGWQVVACGVCELDWERATGAKPTTFFARAEGERK
jgi:hypothetical protein